MASHDDGIIFSYLARYQHETNVGVGIRATPVHAMPRPACNATSFNYLKWLNSARHVDNWAASGAQRSGAYANTDRVSASE